MTAPVALRSKPKSRSRHPHWRSTSGTPNSTSTGEPGPPPPLTNQLPLPLPHAASFAAADFIADASNAAALAWLARPESWPLGRLLLAGPAGCGKTHLLRAYGWPTLSAGTLHDWPAIAAGADTQAGIAIDDADHAADPHALLHLLNAAAERGRRVLLAARLPPASWTIPLPDLASRLRATTVAPIGPATDALLDGLLQKHLADRQLRVDPATRLWLLRRLPRDAAAIAAASATLDTASLAAGRAVTVPLARDALAGLLDDPEANTPEHDGSMSPPAAPCPSADPLL